MGVFVVCLSNYPTTLFSFVVGEILTDNAHYQKGRQHGLRRVRYTNATRNEKEYFNLRKDNKSALAYLTQHNRKGFFKPPRPKSLGSVSSGIVCCYSGSVTDRGRVREGGKDKFHQFGVTCRSTSHRNGKRHQADRRQIFYAVAKKL